MTDKRKRVRAAAALSLAALLLAGLACSENPTPVPLDPAGRPRMASTSTAYGFFTSPPRLTLESVMGHFRNLGDHGDFVLLQPSVPWLDFVEGAEVESASRQDLLNQALLAQQNGLDWVVVVDPLNGLNRRQFASLPQGWDPSFANPAVREAFRNFTMWVLTELEPDYLGLASEINTYADAHPQDFPHYLSLYRETYALIKNQAPATKVFVTFQWEDLNNLFPEPGEARAPYDTKWEQVEAFEPELDLWVISSYPFVSYSRAADIPPDYYTPLLQRTDKPLAVAEGGFPSSAPGPFAGSPEDQLGYLQAIHDQIGDRLLFWVYLILSDLDEGSYRQMMQAQGVASQDIETLGLFTRVGLIELDGTPKPALRLWDEIRRGGLP